MWMWGWDKLWYELIKNYTLNNGVVMIQRLTLLSDNWQLCSKYLFLYDITTSQLCSKYVFSSDDMSSLAIEQLTSTHIIFLWVNEDTTGQGT